MPPPEYVVYRNETGGRRCTATCPQQASCLSVGPLLYPNEDIDYCLAEKAESHCKLYFNTLLLLLVLLCNIGKLLCLFSTLMLARYDPLITVGDAIASFISFPEESTMNRGALTYDDF